jgi:hypothetical protein
MRERIHLLLQRRPFGTGKVCQYIKREKKRTLGKYLLVKMYRADNFFPVGSRQTPDAAVVKIPFRIRRYREDIQAFFSGELL